MSSSDFVSLLFDSHRTAELKAKSSYYPTKKEKKRERPSVTSEPQPLNQSLSVDATEQ